MSNWQAARHAEFIGRIVRPQHRDPTIWTATTYNTVWPATTGGYARPRTVATEDEAKQSLRQKAQRAA